MKFQSKIELLIRPVDNVRPVTSMRKLLFAYIIFNFIQISPLIDVLYGAQTSIIATQSLSGFTLTNCVNLLSVNALKNYYLVFFFTQVVFSFIGLFGFYPRISSFIVFFTTLNLQNRIYSTVSGGDILLCLMFFYLSFISDGKKAKNEYLYQIQNAFDRIFIWLCKIQLLIVYSVSALYKLQSRQWLDGSALQQILLIDEYSVPFLQHAVCSFPFIFKLLTWLAFLYQILFPVLIFVKPIKNYLLLIGVIFHLFIAFGMGLFNFSLVMICCYAIFYESKRERR